MCVHANPFCIRIHANICLSIYLIVFRLLNISIGENILSRKIMRFGLNNICQCPENLFVSVRISLAMYVDIHIRTTTYVCRFHKLINLYFRAKVPVHHLTGAFRKAFTPACQLLQSVYYKYT